MRRMVKTGIAGGLRWSGVSLLKRTLYGRSRVPWIVGYHRVVEDFAGSARHSIPATLVSRAMLERHLEWIGRRYDLVPLDEIESRLAGGGVFRRPAAALTFDDGYADVYEQAFPILKARGVPAAVFVVTALIGTSQIPLYDRLYLALVRAWDEWPSPPEELVRFALTLEIRTGWRHAPRAASDPLRILRLLLESVPQSELERLAVSLERQIGVDERKQREHRPFTWDMIHELRRSGFTIGSHSRTHSLLTKEGEDAVRQETLGSRRDLEAALGAPVRHFAYPNGWFNAATIQAVESAGYRCAYTSCQHRDPAHPLHTLPRTLLWENSSLGAFGGFSPAVMGCQADGIFDRPALCPLDHWN